MLESALLQIDGIIQGGEIAAFKLCPATPLEEREQTRFPSSFIVLLSAVFRSRDRG